MPKFTSTPTDSLIIQNGFSLLEVLVAIVLLSTILALLYNAFFQISDATKDIADSLKAEQELRLLMKIVLDDLQAVQFLERLIVHNHADEAEYYHTGIFSRRISGPDEKRVNFIHFHTAIPTRFFPQAIELEKDPELHEVEYYLDFDAFSQKWLFKRREDFYVDADISEGGIEQILSESVVGFDLQFMEQNILQANGELREVWVEEWDSREGDCTATPQPGKIPCLPLAVRLTMALKRQNNLIVSDVLEVNLPLSLQQ